MRAAALFLLLLALWLGWSGLYKPLLIGLGVVSCLLCVWVAGRMRDTGAIRVEPRMVLRILAYLPWLAKEVALANWQVIRLVLSPRLTVRPVVMKVKASQRTDLGRVIYGNSITLTPGTLTMDVEGDQLTVHALTSDGAEQLRSGVMDARVARLESSS